MNSIMISIVLPVYNVEKYLDECLESIYNQSFKNFELIIVNDGSTDKSEEIINKYIDKKGDNIKYIKQENLGVSEARNNAISYITGKYTLFLDPDDYIESDMLKQLYNEAEKKCSDITICGYNMFYELNINNKVKVNYQTSDELIHSNKEIMNRVLNNEIICFLWNKLFLSENLNKYKIYFEKDRYSQDWFPVFKLMYYAKNIVIINKPLYNYRIRGNSNSHKKSIKKVYDHNIAIKSISNFIKKENINIDYKLLYKFIITHQFMNLKMCIESKTFSTNVYDICKIDTVKFNKVLFNNKISINEKIKFTAYKLRLLHIYYILKNNFKN
ncbi:MAG: glycosyltransferase [Clostridium butyricum]|nr:glycosyltransferase [Clostridium butyricum]MDU4802757.1 glycosyltransferase [Clostridium butyricum]